MGTWKWISLLFLLLVLAVGARPRVLYSTQGDTNADGRLETVEVLSEVPDPTQEAERWIVIRQGSKVLYQSPRMKMQFHPEFNSEESRVGVVLKKTEGSKYPGIMVVLTPHSGNLVLIRYNGKVYKLIDSD